MPLMLIGLVTDSQEAVEQIAGHFSFDCLLDSASGNLLVFLEDVVGLALTSLGENLDECVLIGAQFGFTRLVQRCRLFGRFGFIKESFIAAALCIVSMVKSTARYVDVSYRDGEDKQTLEWSRSVAFNIALQTGTVSLLVSGGDLVYFLVAPGAQDLHQGVFVGTEALHGAVQLFRAVTSCWHHQTDNHRFEFTAQFAF